MSNVRTVLASLAVLGMVLQPAVRADSGTGECYSSDYAMVQAVPCKCQSNNCPAYSNGAIPYEVCGIAVQGEVGRDECYNEEGLVGTAYKCTKTIVWGHLAICVGVMAACTVACALVTTGAGVAGCLACLFSGGGQCGQPCYIYTCEVDPNTTIDILRDQLDRFEGEGCSG